LASTSSTRASPDRDGFSLDLYHLLEDDGAPITDNDHRWKSSRHCGARCRTGGCAVCGVAARAAPGAHVNTPTQIAFSVDERNRAWCWS